MNRIVGIIPTKNINKDDNPYTDNYSFVDLFAKNVFEFNVIPYGILLNNGEIDYGSLNMCDGFIIPGGTKIDKACYELINYCIQNNKPLLGICMGSEAIAIYSNIYPYINNNNINELLTIYQQLKKDNNGSLLLELNKNNIHSHVINRSNKDIARHKINIKRKTLLFDIYKKDSINVISLHNHDYKLIGKNFIVSSYAEDNVCESIEFNDNNYFILGVHFHPELDDDNLIFKRLIKEIDKRKTQEK